MTIVICSQQRTGSCMLRTMLEQIPGLTVGGEVCVSTLRHWWSSWTDAPQSPYIMRLHKYPRKHIQYVCKYLDVWNVHDSHLWGYQQRKDVDLSFPFHYVLADMDVRIVWLSREDVALQALSYEMAVATNTWSVRANQSNDSDLRFTSHPEYLLEIAKTLLHIRTLTKGILAHRPSIGVTYEQLCDAPEIHFPRICEFMEVKPIVVTPQTQKTYKKPMSEIVVNYDEALKHIYNNLVCLTDYSDRLIF